MAVTRDTRPGQRSEKRRRPTGHAVREAPGVAARRGALALLSGVLDRGQMPGEAALERLAPPARAEARGLADLTLRRLGQIDHALSRFVDRRPKPPGLHVLRLMAAELLFAGTAPHGAVDSAVRLARSTPGAERLAGLVNAVGRRLAEADAPGDGAGEIRRNMPKWLRQRLVGDWGEAEADRIAAAHLAPAPHDLTPRDPGEASALAEALGAMPLPGGGLRLPGRPQISALEGHEDGRWWVQDVAAAQPARLLGPVAGLRVLDACAAPGGKTMQLAAAGASVTALDLSERRMERVAENLARTGLAAETVVADALAWQPEAPFDAILLDAPCSATGTIRRHPDLPWLKGAEDVAALAALQARLLDRAFGWLKPGGRLVYAVCSILKAEGEAQTAAFLDRTPAARRVPLAPSADLPAAWIDADGDFRTLPSMLPEAGHLDGFFACRIERAG